MMRLFDTHAHMIDARFDEDREELFAMMREQGLIGHIEIIAAPQDIDAARSLAESYEGVFLAAGIHPEDADKYDDALEERIKQAAGSSKAVAIGEIGLDYCCGIDDREKQKEVFRRQMALAERMGLPVVVHSRDAMKETLDILREFPQVRGVMHCFSGSAETAEEVIRMGWYIGIGGTVTFKNNKKTAAAAKSVPLEKILLETDSPYLAPDPYRGKRNMPLYTGIVAAKIGEIKGLSVEKVAQASLENAERLFGFDLGGF